MHPRKIAVASVAGDAHHELLEMLERMILDSLKGAGVNAVKLERLSDLDGTTHVIVPGVGRWGSPRLETMLAEAGRLGARRVLWQLETLPPADLPNSFAARFALRSSAHRSPVWSRFLDKLAVQRLAAECAPLSWNQPVPHDDAALRLPIREARYIKRLWRAKLLDKAIASLETRVAFLASMGVDTIFMPFGYNEAWGRPNASIEKDTDVLFLGEPTPRRSKLLAALDSALTAAGYQLKIVDSGLYGARRYDAIARSKVFLHLRNYAWELPRIRLMMAIAAGALYATEEFPDTRPFVRGRHFVMAPWAKLPEVIVTYLQNDEARRRITAEAAQFAIEELDLGRMLVDACSQA